MVRERPGARPRRALSARAAARRGGALGWRRAAARRPTARGLARLRAADQRGRPLGGADERAARRGGAVSAGRSGCTSSARARGSTCCSTDIATISAASRRAIAHRASSSSPNGRVRRRPTRLSGSSAAPAPTSTRLACRGTRARLLAYLWPDQPERLARLEAALAIAADDPPRVDKADAADWIEASLALAPEPGVTRVVMHSVAFQYFGPASAGAGRAPYRGGRRSRRRGRAAGLAALREGARRRPFTRSGCGPGPAARICSPGPIRTAAASHG